MKVAMLLALLSADINTEQRFVLIIYDSRQIEVCEASDEDEDP